MSASYETIRHLTLTAMGHGLTVAADAGTEPPTVTVLAGSDWAMHDFRASLKIPGQSIWTANVVDARAATRHVVTAPQIAILPDGLRVDLPKDTVIRDAAETKATAELLDAGKLKEARTAIEKLAVELRTMMHFLTPRGGVQERTNDEARIRTLPPPGLDPRDPDESQLRALLSALGIDRWEVRDGTLWITALRPWCRGRNLVTSAARRVLGPGWRVELALDPVAPPPHPSSVSGSVEPTRTKLHDDTAGEPPDRGENPKAYGLASREPAPRPAVSLAKIQITEAIPPSVEEPGVLHVESDLSPEEVTAALASVFGDGWHVILLSTSGSEVGRK